MKVLYPAIFSYDEIEKRYTIQFPDLSEAITEGETFAEAYFNASEVLTLTIEGRIDENLEIPKPSSQIKNAKLIAPSARAQAALLLRWTKGKRKTAELARSLQTSWPAVNRLEDPRHWPNLKQLEKVAASLGQILILDFQPLYNNDESKTHTKNKKREII